MPSGRPEEAPPPIVVTGVSGAGKTTVGMALAARLDVPFLDSDDLHDAAAVAKMSSGAPLDDDDRWPWLDRAGAWLAEHAAGGVLACSALKRSYRERLLRAAPSSWFVQLVVDQDVLDARLASRTNHFMPRTLLRSQLVAFEPLEGDEPGVTVDAGHDVDAVVQTTIRRARWRTPR